MFDKGLFGKLPVAFQTVLGLVLFVFGAMMVLFSTEWAGQDTRFFLLFVAVGVLYVATGMPPMLEGAMTMVYKKKEE